MSEITFKIDGVDVKGKAGQTIWKLLTQPASIYRAFALMKD